MGCAYPWPSITRTAGCNGQHCEVAVAAGQHDTPPFGCFVDSVTPYTLEVRNPRPVTIQWYLDSGSVDDAYRFSNPGIVFDNPMGWDCKNIANDARVECINTAALGSHKYTVYLRKGSARCDPRDPWVVNQ
jgi:hypothetical protein